MPAGFFGSIEKVPLTPSAVPLIFSRGASLDQLNWFLPTLSLIVARFVPDALTVRGCAMALAPAIRKQTAAASDIRENVMSITDLKWGVQRRFQSEINCSARRDRPR